MDHIDEFESMFRRAERELLQFAEIPLQSIAFITDQPAAETQNRLSAVQRFLPSVDGSVQWHPITGDQYSNVGDLLSKIDEQQLDLIVTYRHLQEESLVPQHSLGVYLDVLTQTTSIQVLVLPGTASVPKPLSDGRCDRTMVVADHISGDNRLINYGVRMTPDDGQLWLCHVEDDAIFERYMRAIEQIPEINTATARDRLEATLLKDATDFIGSCISELQQARGSIKYESRVARGHFLKHYTELIHEAGIDLLVTNTKDEDQLAMHGMAYSLSVELVEIAMLLL